MRSKFNSKTNNLLRKWLDIIKKYLKLNDHNDIPILIL